MKVATPEFPDVLKRELANARTAAWSWQRRYRKLRYTYSETCRRFHERRQTLLVLIDAMQKGVGQLQPEDREKVFYSLQKLRDILDPKPSPLMPPPGMGTRG